MMRLAVEAGDIRGQRGQHMPALLLAFPAFHEGAIPLEILQSEHAQPLCKPRIGQQDLALRHRNPGFAVEDFCHALKMRHRQDNPVILDDLHRGTAHYLLMLHR